MDSLAWLGASDAPEPDFMSAKRASARVWYSFTAIAEHENLLRINGVKQKVVGKL